MTDVVAVEAPWEGARAWKYDRSMDERAQPYVVDFPGPWDDEPDKVQWVDPATGLDCLVVRNHFGSLCGYVGVPAGHPAYGVPYDEPDVEVHGGLTFADTCSGESADGQPSAGICHVPEPGRPHDVYWLGFDCGHAFDFQPGMRAMEMRVMPDLLERFDKNKPYDHEAVMKTTDEWGTERYRTLDYVRAEISDLAEQLAALAPSS